MNITREDFKMMSAGQFVLGKPSIDIKELQIYVDASVNAYDFLTKKQLEEKNKSEKSKQEQGNGSSI